MLTMKSFIYTYLLTMTLINSKHCDNSREILLLGSLYILILLMAHFWAILNTPSDFSKIRIRRIFLPSQSVFLAFFYFNAMITKHCGSLFCLSKLPPTRNWLPNILQRAVEWSSKPSTTPTHTDTHTHTHTHVPACLYQSLHSSGPVVKLSDSFCYRKGRNH